MRKALYVAAAIGLVACEGDDEESLPEIEHET